MNIITNNYQFERFNIYKEMVTNNHQRQTHFFLKKIIKRNNKQERKVALFAKILLSSLVHILINKV